MKRLLWALPMLWSLGVSAATLPAARLIDSLRIACESQTDPQPRVDLLLDLKDLTDSSDDEMRYARMLYREAFDAGDAFAVGASLGSLASHYIGMPDGDDSLASLLDRVAPLLEGSTMEGLPAYYRMVACARKIQVAGGTEEAVALSHAYLDSIATAPEGDLYDRAARLFLKGVAAFTLASAEGRNRMERGLPYWNDELELLPRMQPTARRNFHANLVTCLIAAYSDLEDQESLVRVADDYLAMLDRYYRDGEIVRRRPYIAREMSYMACYYTMCTSPLLDREQAEAYYNRYCRFMRSVMSSELRQENILLNKRGFYNISVGYYHRRGDTASEMAYNDSLILMMRPNGISPLLASMYDRRAKLLEKKGHYREACRVYGELIDMRDSLAENRYTEKVGELEVRYGLEKVEHERATLLAQKRKVTLYFIVVVLLLALLAVIHLWLSLRHVKRLQRELQAESERALESDRLKSDFLGSMSHEVRTPLNAINGFAELIAEGSLSAEEHAEFAQIIRTNTRQFTNLINDMLEVAQLDNTSRNLPKTPMDICRIVRTEFERLPPKEGVACELILAEPEVVIPLHRSYVSMLVRELLGNALKFTERGSVKVECGSVENGELLLSVTDTGCGIDPTLAEKVFERFYQVNGFAQGLGLGLSLCRLVAEKLGGSIRLDTTCTRGTRFVVRFPVD